MMHSVTYQRGDLVLVDLEPVIGSEQGMKRPCVVLSNAATVRASGSRLVYFVIPLTSAKKLRGPLAPILEQSEDGLRADSVALIMHARSISPARILAKWGQVSAQDVTTLQAAVKHLIES